MFKTLCSSFRLDEALSQYFGAGAEVAQPEALYPAVSEPIRKCPQCGKDMVLKTKKGGGSVPTVPPSPAPHKAGHCGVVLQGRPAVTTPGSGLGDVVVKLEA